MGIQHAVSAAPARPEHRLNGPDARAGSLQGRALLLARLAWIVTALSAVAVFVMSLPAHYDHLLHNTGPRQVAAALREAQLRTLGFSNTGYAAYMFALDLLLPAGFIVVGCLIVWRKSNEWPPLLFGHLLIVVGIASSRVPQALETGLPHVRTAVESFQIYGSLALFLLAYLFPDGQFVPRWAWLPALIYLAVNAAELLLPGTPLDFAMWPPALNITLLLLVLGSLQFAQIYRYRRVSNPVQRQQTKWVMLGISIAILANLLYSLLDRLFSPLQTPSAFAVYVHFVAVHINTGGSLLIPITVAFALLRYRLWDVDPIINRALVYGALTVSVVALYSLVVGSLSLVFQTSANPLIALAATGVVATGLQPLHTRLQRGVNRLLYGERDEPYRVLARLGQRLETTLVPEAALHVIVGTVQEALKLPYVAIALKHGPDMQVVAAVGTIGANFSP